MRIALFVPCCYIDAFFPEVGIATLELLERLGHEFIYPRDQTCCGQPTANSGFNADCAATEALSCAISPALITLSDPRAAASITSATISMPSSRPQT
jgi:hypothetical protein